MATHDRLGVLLAPEAGDVRKHAVLVDTGCQTGAADHGHQKDEVEVDVGIAGHDCGDCQHGEHDDIDEKRYDDAAGVGGAAL